MNDSGLSGSVSSEHAKDRTFLRILDPATGTGTFHKVVKQIRSNLKRYWTVGMVKEQKIRVESICSWYTGCAKTIRGKVCSAGYLLLR